MHSYTGHLLLVAPAVKPWKASSATEPCPRLQPAQRSPVSRHDEVRSIVSSNMERWCSRRVPSTPNAPHSRRNLNSSVTDCVTVPELRWPSYDCVMVNYGALKSCYGALKRCYVVIHRVVGRSDEDHRGPTATAWGPPMAMGSTASQIRPFSKPRMFATHKAIAKNAPSATIWCR
jgi:hypothetical protein